MTSPHCRSKHICQNGLTDAVARCTRLYIGQFIAKMAILMSYSLRNVLLKLCQREDLGRDETREAFEFIMSGQASEAQVGGLLVGLAAKGTTIEELTGAATVMRQNVIAIPHDNSQVVIDTCGTGGTVRSTFNISTVAALIVAGAGVAVAKHGNRAASSKTGSADVLEQLGVRLDVSPAGLANCLCSANICFAFARQHHPAMKYVSSVRTALAIPTIFNMLGPLTNPAGARHQLLGVFAAELTDRFAAVLRELGSERAWIVHAFHGLDEISTVSPTRISELNNGHIKTYDLDARDLGLPAARLSDLEVSGPAESAGVIKSILAGNSGPAADIACLNAAAALIIAGAAEDLHDGLIQARRSIASGAAANALAKLKEISQAG